MISTVNSYVVYAGDGVADTFPYGFPVYDEDHFVVYLRNATTRVLTLLDPSAYTVTGIGEPTGGNIITDDPVTVGTSIVIVRVVPLAQGLDVMNQGGFYPENVEAQLDLIEMQIQQIDDEVNRSVRGPITEVWPELPPPAERAGQFLGFTTDANAYPTIDTDGLLFTALSNILASGPGISITAGGGIITITNLNPDPQDCWLLEDGTSGGGGGGSDPETIRDVIGTALQGLGCVIAVDDGANTITVDLTQDATAEVIRDVMGIALVSGSGITVTPNDPGNTITISVDTAGFGEIARDALGTALIGGPGITVTPNDPGDTITLSGDPKILATASAATVTPTFAYDQVNITAQAVGLTLANPTGTAVDGHGILIRIKDNGTSRTIAYGTKYRTFNDTLPTATTISKTLYIGIVYNAADDKWDVLGVRQQA